MPLAILLGCALAMALPVMLVAAATWRPVQSGFLQRCGGDTGRRTQTCTHQATHSVRGRCCVCTRVGHRTHVAVLFVWVAELEMADYTREKNASSTHM